MFLILLVNYLTEDIEKFYADLIFNHFLTKTGINLLFLLHNRMHLLFGRTGCHIILI